MQLRLPLPHALLPLSADEWANFLERMGSSSQEELQSSEEGQQELQAWASYRGQTLWRTGGEGGGGKGSFRESE